MTEYFITARSFAAPFVSDPSDGFVEAGSPEAALEQFAAGYSHPCGLYAAECWTDANAFHRSGAEPLARWYSNELQALNAATEGGGHSVYKNENGLEVDGKKILVEDPRGGSVVSV